jgi:hypothetical protein
VGNARYIGEASDTSDDGRLERGAPEIQGRDSSIGGRGYNVSPTREEYTKGQGTQLEGSLEQMSADSRTRIGVCLGGGCVLKKVPDPIWDVSA